MVLRQRALGVFILLVSVAGSLAIVNRDVMEVNTREGEKTYIQEQHQMVTYK